MEKVNITELQEMLVHVKLEVDKRSIPAKQKQRMTRFISRLVTDAYQLGKTGKITVEISDG